MGGSKFKMSTVTEKRGDALSDNGQRRHAQCDLGKTVMRLSGAGSAVWAALTRSLSAHNSGGCTGDMPREEQALVVRVVPACAEDAAAATEVQEGGAV